MIKLVVLVLSLYILLLVLTFFFQGKMVFFPDPSLVATPASVGLSYDNVWLTTSDQVRVHGWYVPGPEGNSRATALFLHGNAGNISHRLDTLELVHKLGLACLIIDYRGYGRSQGTPSEKGMYADAEAAWAWLVQTKGVDPESIVCWGRSLGGPVAAHLAHTRGPGALILESTFTSLPDLGQKLYPFLPVHLISFLRFPTITYVRDLKCPLLVVHSSQDQLVPVHMGQKLFQIAPEPKRFVQIQGDHNQGFLVSRDRYLHGVQAFLQELGPLASGPPE